MEAWRSYTYGSNIIRGTSELPQIFHFFLQPVARPGCPWASSGLFSVTVLSSWASCPLLLRNGRKFQHGYSFILHFGEKAKLLLEVLASWPRGQNIFHISLLQSPPRSSHLLCDMLVGCNSHFHGFLGVTVSQVGSSSSRERIPFGLTKLLVSIFLAEKQQTSWSGAQTPVGGGRGRCSQMPILALPVTSLDKPLNWALFSLSLKLLSHSNTTGSFHEFKLRNMQRA